MIYDLQKASVGKRIIAFIFDLIMFATLAVGIAYIISVVGNYAQYSERLKDIREEYSEEYQVQLDITSEEYAALSESELARYKEAEDAFSKDEEANELYSTMLNFMIVIISVSPLVSCLVLEFAVPLLFGNGQTLGKKIFGIGIMLDNGVKITGIALFTRSILGKFAIETAIPIIAFLMMIFAPSGLFGALIILALVVANLALLLFNSKRTLIHDIVSYTVCVDLASQMIFESEEALLEYKNTLHAEANDFERSRT